MIAVLPLLPTTLGSILYCGFYEKNWPGSYEVYELSVCVHLTINLGSASWTPEGRLSGREKPQVNDGDHQTFYTVHICVVHNFTACQVAGLPLLVVG